MKLTDASVAGEPIKQGIMVQRLEINFSEETKEFLLKALQAEPVVHCKDCTHRYQHDSGRYFCEMYYGMGDVSDENYCSFGER